MKTLSRIAAMTVPIATLLLSTGCALTGPRRLGLNHIEKNAATYLLFDDGSACCRIVLPAEPKEEETQAADELRTMLKKIGSVEIPLVADPAPPSGLLSIHVGQTQLARQINPVPATLDADGFAITPIDQQNLLLTGGRSVSTFYAVTEFLERYAGVLWVWPRENGTVIPHTPRLEVTVAKQISEPAFRARRFSGMRGAKMRYYRIHQTPRERRSEFHHNVWKVLKPETYWETHPEYFAEIDGKRREPARHNANWQACTSNPDVVSIFVEAAKKQFRKYPWNISFSVSQNDGGGFCQCDACRALDVPGRDGISDRYFTFMNQVADGIRDEFPDKFVCCLAYSRATRNIPKRIRLRTNTMVYPVIPTLSDEHGDIRAWSRVAPNLGVYFWLHGKAVPKFYPTRFADYLRFLRRRNVKEVYAEVYQDNPERMATFELDGPRVWITAKLLWNPDANVDELMTMLCKRFYGRGAEPMKRYYTCCETAWNRRENPFDFGKKWRDLEFDSYSADDMDVLESCLDEALRLAESPVVISRLTDQKSALAKTALFVRQLSLPDTLARLPVQNRGDADTVVKTVAQAEQTSRQMAEKGHSLFGGMANRSEKAIDDAFSRLSHMLGQSATAYWEAKRKTHPQLARFISTQLIDLQGIHPNIIDNPSFETVSQSGKTADEKLNWKQLDAPGWDSWLRPGTRGRVTVTDKTARTGARALVIHGCEAACGIRSLPVKTGERYRITVFAKTNAPPPDTPADAKPAATLTVKWQTADGKWMSQPPEILESIPGGTHEWKRLTTAATITPGVGRLIVLLGAKSQEADQKAWFDDCLVEKLYTPGE